MDDEVFPEFDIGLWIVLRGRGVDGRDACNRALAAFGLYQGEERTHSVGAVRVEVVSMLMHRRTEA